MGANPGLPLLADIPGSAGPAENGHASIRRAELDSSRATLAGLRSLAEDLRCALVTSAGAGDALAVAIGVATAAALEGGRVMLIECHIAKPDLARRLGLALNPGLAEYLAWEATAQQILRPLDLSGAAVGAADRVGQLVCVVGGSPQVGVSGLFATDSFAGAMRRVRDGYQLVVLAGAPLTAPELPLIARHADAIAICTQDHQLAAANGAAAADHSRLAERPVGIVRVGESGMGQLS
jgi:Mrp family chromosome partitioning ATPase